jgi:hypothetical protein
VHECETRKVPGAQKYLEAESDREAIREERINFGKSRYAG